MKKQAFFFIDDVIWVFRDLTRQRPSSLFDNPFLNVLKTAHDKFGMKTQLNAFYRTDYFYGDDEFTLADMTDAYHNEWEAASEWLKIGFHAKQEFPDYPHINASYKDVKDVFTRIQKEVFRFASPKNFAYSVVPHWMPISKDGCHALKDCGVKLLAVSVGDTREYDGDPSCLPYGHAARLLQNRKPETRLYQRGATNAAINDSVCGYNHLSSDLAATTEKTAASILDSETGLFFKDFIYGHNFVLDLIKKENLSAKFNEVIDNEYIGYATHEQYFHSDYYAYQPDYAEKIYIVAKMLADADYTYIFAEDLV